MSKPRPFGSQPPLPRTAIQRRGKRVLMSDGQTSATTDATDLRISVLAEISRDMVRLYKEQFGRGPTRARSDFAGPDTVIALSRTPSPLPSAGSPKWASISDCATHASYFQYATEEQFRSVIEGLLKCKVRAFISGIDTNNDISAEIFYLEPVSDNGS
jgi:uncharacterized protein YbcI